MELNPDRFFDPDPAQRQVARQLYTSVCSIPLICPHGHIDPAMLADPDYSFGTPVDMLIIPDHYVFRMLYSQGITLEDVGIYPLSSIEKSQEIDKEARHQRAWNIFAENFYLFHGTPTGIWLRHELVEVFRIHEALTPQNAEVIYDDIVAKLASPEFRPRALFDRFNIHTLCTTDSASDSLEQHASINTTTLKGHVRPTFRPDKVVNIGLPGWKEHVNQLSVASGIDIYDYQSFISAIENRRVFFKKMGATSTDQGVLSLYTEELPIGTVETIFQRALKGLSSSEDHKRFAGHLLMEMARMSLEDGLVMQVHPGSFRNHNSWLHEVYGTDKGADIPVTTEYTRNLIPLLNKYGNDKRFSLILFTLDESAYARELAPLAGHYPAVKLGPPWWFHDSLNGMRRYFDQVVETAGLYNTAGFNDDTRAFCSIPARHDLWRRAACNWLAGLVVRYVIGEAEAHQMAIDCAVNLVKQAYHLD